MGKFYSIIDLIFGADPDLLTVWQMAERATVVYILGIILLRFHRRFMNIRTTNNFFLYIMMGSILASCIVGMIDFIHSLCAVSIIMGLNIITNILAFHIPAFERLIRGTRVTLVSNGKIDWQAMRKNCITYEELMDAVHRANIDNLENTRFVYFEPSGRISVIWKQKT